MPSYYVFLNKMNYHLFKEYNELYLIRECQTVCELYAINRPARFPLAVSSAPTLQVVSN